MTRRSSLVDLRSLIFAVSLPILTPFQPQRQRQRQQRVHANAAQDPARSPRRGPELGAAAPSADGPRGADGRQGRKSAVCGSVRGPTSGRVPPGWTACPLRPTTEMNSYRSYCYKAFSPSLYRSQRLRSTSPSQIFLWSQTREPETGPAWPAWLKTSASGADGTACLPRDSWPQRPAAGLS